MEDIIELFYCGFSERLVPEDSEYRKLMDEVVTTENKLVASFTPEQQELYHAFMQTSNEVEIECEHELIKYILKMISQIFNYQKNKD